MFPWCKTAWSGLPGNTGTWRNPQKYIVNCMLGYSPCQGIFLADVRLVFFLQCHVGMPDDKQADKIKWNSWNLIADKASEIRCGQAHREGKKQAERNCKN